jgi:hypothetical protein
MVSMVAGVCRIPQRVTHGTGRHAHTDNADNGQAEGEKIPSGNVKMSTTCAVSIHLILLLVGRQKGVVK